MLFFFKASIRSFVDVEGFDGSGTALSNVPRLSMIGRHKAACISSLPQKLKVDTIICLLKPPPRLRPCHPPPSPCHPFPSPAAASTAAHNVHELPMRIIPLFDNVALNGTVNVIADINFITDSNKICIFNPYK